MGDDCKSESVFTFPEGMLATDTAFVPITGGGRGSEWGFAVATGGFDTSQVGTPCCCNI